MKCIFCRTERNDSEFSDEHVFPEAIGSKLTIRSVCKPCNDYLGHSIDTHLTNHPFIQFKRHLLGLSGKSNKLPNPLEYGILSEHPDQKLIYILDSEGKPEELYIVPNVSREKLQDGTEKVSIRVDAKDKKKIPGIINRIRERAGLPPMSEEEIEKQQRRESIPNPWMNIKMQVDLQKYKRAVLKIAYELAWRWLGPTYLEDPIAETIRACIMDRSLKGDWASKYPVKGTINFIDGKTVFPMWQQEDNSHIAFVMPSGHELACYVRVFQVFEGMINISTDAKRYTGFDGHFVAIDPVTANLRESTLYEEIGRIGQGAG